MPSAIRPEEDAKVWIVIGDIHDEPKNFALIPELAGASGLIISGDLTVNGGARQAERVICALKEAMPQKDLPLWAQFGNMDRADVDSWLSQQGLNIHTRVCELAPGVAMFGVGGSSVTPFGTPSEFSETDYAAWLKTAWEKARDFPLRVLVSHNPPLNSACDLLPSGAHVGSSAVREFIEAAQPDVCLCGHIHEARALDRIGRCQVLNPGALAQGGYGLLRYAQGRLLAELRVL